MSKIVRRTDDPRALLDRILETPQLAQVVPQLPPELLHRLIQHCGLEDCGEIVALTTPEQLERIFDLDLWRGARPGVEEQFDADRFGRWLEVLAESGADVAARKLAELDVHLVITGLAQHARVFDIAAVESYETTDGDLVEMAPATGDAVTSDVGGYRLAPKRTGAWEAIVDVLTALNVAHPERFQRVMRGCLDLSNEGFERDGLDDLLADKDQAMFDMAADREGRRDAQGFVTPVQARAFLSMSRQPPHKGKSKGNVVPVGNLIARAHLRAAEETPLPDVPAAPDGSVEAVAAVVEVLRDAGILGAPPRALLTGSIEPASPLARLEAHMQFVFNRNPVVYSARSAELAYLANAIVAGCSIQSRPFTVQEASDAAASVCNLGLENWPRLTDDVLLHHDLIDVFQAGWTLLHDEVVMYAAGQLVEALKGFQYHDREIQAALNRLRIELKKSLRAGTPWLSRDAMEVLATLDMPAWFALLGMIDECPVLHAAVRASQTRGTRAIGADDFEFIAGNSQIASIHTYLETLLETLSS